VEGLKVEKESFGQKGKNFVEGVKKKETKKEGGI